MSHRRLALQPVSMPIPHVGDAGLSVAGEEDPGAALDATISWTDGDSQGSAAIPISNDRRHLASQAIQVDAMKAP